MLNIISTGKLSKNTENATKGTVTKQLIITRNGKSFTKHVVLKDAKKGIFMDSHGIPYIIN